MKKLFIFAVIALTFLVGCEMLGPVVVDHSATVEHFTNGVIYDFDQPSPLGSGWVFTDLGGSNMSVTNNAEVIDMWYNDRDYDDGNYLVAPDGDKAVYDYGDKTVKATRFKKIGLTSVIDVDSIKTAAAPTTIDNKSVDVENDAWYWIKLADEDNRNTKYVLMRITNVSTDKNTVNFEYWIQKDGTRYFGIE